MPRRKLSEPAVKVTINLFLSDYNRMKELYPSIGPQIAIRSLLRQHIQNVDRKLSLSKETLIPEIDLEIENVG